MLADLPSLFRFESLTDLPALLAGPATIAALIYVVTQIRKSWHEGSKTKLETEKLRRELPRQSPAVAELAGKREPRVAPSRKEIIAFISFSFLCLAQMHFASRDPELATSILGMLSGAMNFIILMMVMLALSVSRLIAGLFHAQYEWFELAILKAQISTLQSIRAPLKSNKDTEQTADGSVSADATGMN